MSKRGISESNETDQQEQEPSALAIEGEPEPDDERPSKKRDTKSDVSAQKKELKNCIAKKLADLEEEELKTSFVQAAAKTTPQIMQAVSEWGKKTFRVQIPSNPTPAPGSVFQAVNPEGQAVQVIVPPLPEGAAGKFIEVPWGGSAGMFVFGSSGSSGGKRKSRKRKTRKRKTRKRKTRKRKLRKRKTRKRKLRKRNKRVKRRKKTRKRRR
jgi:hypothetical protein